MAAGRLRVAVVGGGPAGASVATLLALNGADVVLFADEDRRELVVGESLVPAIIPSLRRLGVEDAVAAISQHKPGVAFTWSGTRVAFRFARYAPRIVPYAYNAPRPEFEEVLRARAADVGARVLRERVRLSRGAPNEPELILNEAARAATGWDGAHPDLLVDATGRARVGVRTLGIPARVGPRDDVAHFAHFTNHAWDEEPGHVLIGRVAGGWSWRIPLRDKLSLGIVVNRPTATRLGTTPLERLERSIAETPDLAATLAGAERVTGVATYANYQLITTRGVGRGWVAIGDAFGFVDPMLSPGTSIALRSAEMLTDALASRSHRERTRSPVVPDAALARYVRGMTNLLESWMDLVQFLYDGRMMALIKAGSEMVEQRGDRLARFISNQAELNAALLASGTSITSRGRRGALRMLGKYGLRGVSPEALAID